MKNSMILDYFYGGFHQGCRSEVDGNRRAKNPHHQLCQDREVYTAYRKTGYSKAFLEAHREENTLHKAAKAAFDEAGLQKLPKVKVLDAEFAEEKDTTEKTQTR